MFLVTAQLVTAATLAGCNGAEKPPVTAPPSPVISEDTVQEEPESTPTQAGEEQGGAEVTPPAQADTGA